MDFIFAAGEGKKEKRKTKREGGKEGRKGKRKNIICRKEIRTECVGLSEVACIYQITQFKLAWPMA